MIRMILDGRRVREVFVCDWCQEAIRDYKAAHILWFVEEDDTTSGDVYHVHSGACSRLLEARIGKNRRCSWSPMFNHLQHLLYNSGVTTARAARDMWERGEEFTQALASAD